jgi:hypothetical protein
MRIDALVGRLLPDLAFLHMCAPVKYFVPGLKFTWVRMYLNWMLSMVFSC